MKRYIIFTLLLILSIWQLVAQNTPSKKSQEYFKQAQALYSSMQLKQALLTIDKALEKDPLYFEAIMLKADMCHEDRNYKLESELYYRGLAIDSTSFVKGWYNLGKAEFFNRHFVESEKAFRIYVRLSAGRKLAPDVDDWIFRSQYAQKALSSAFKLEPVNLGKGVNSAYDEYWPSLTADENTLVFTVQVPRDTALFKAGKLPNMSQFFQEDFYVSRCDTGDNWQQRVPISPLNTPGNEGAQTMSADGKWMFFTACSRPDGKGSCDIYFARQTANGWSIPVNLGQPVNTPFTETQPTFSADGRTLYFISNRSGGMGGNDIWKATIVAFGSNGKPIFSAPVNLGKEVNSEKGEASPFIHPDGHTLYFSSKGWPGMGEMDIFVTRRDSLGNWQKPENLGYPINTPGDEIGLVVNTKGNRAYYSTDGIDNSIGGRDIYSFILPDEARPVPVSYVKGHVFDAETQKHLGAHFELLRLSDGNVIVESFSDERNGEFLLCLPPGDNYALNVAREGYLFYSGNFDLKQVHDACDPQLVNIPLKPIKVGQAVVLKNVFFDSDSYQLKPESQVELDKLVTFLQQNASVSIEIQGHTDNVGTAAYNLDLSSKRAQSVVDYLLTKGVNTSRMTSKGFGLTQPVATNDTEEGRAQNRRTEMRIVKR
jgi:outer membrane protein OmpA-like peptidoglycan-associated protein